VIRSAYHLIWLVFLVVIFSCTAAVPAQAAPELDVTLERDSAAFPTVYHSDERVDFTVKVKNEAAALGAPSEGDSLSCTTTNDNVDWLEDLNINYSFEFRWVRDGVPLTAWMPPTKVFGGGGTGSTYLSTYAVQAADKERAIQCLVKGTNGAGTGSYVVASQPVTVVNPQPVVAAPRPINPTAITRRPTIAGSATVAGNELTCTAPTTNWSTVATAKTVSGSNTLTEVFTGKGTGTTANGSNVVTGVTTTAGAFLVGQTITIPASTVAPGTTITSISGTTLTLSNPVTAGGGSAKALNAGAQPFTVGQTITGAGIPANTTIAAVSGQTLTLSANATASASNVQVFGSAAGTATTTSGSNTLTAVSVAQGNGTLTSGSTSVTGVTTTSGAFLAGQTITAPGIPAGTTIVSVGAGTLELSAAATASGAEALSAGAQPFAVGQILSGAGIPAGTKVTAVSGQTLTLSANATASASGVALSAPITGGWSFEWLRDGQPATGTVTFPTATTSKYTLTAGDVSEPAAPAVFQCVARATNASGAALVESISKLTTTPAPAFVAGTEGDAPLPQLGAVPKVESAANTAAGQITVEVELPNGLQTFAFKTEPDSWSCDKIAASDAQPARATCTREELMRPGGQYPALKVITALGADAPDLATAKATAFGAGALVPTVDELTFPIEPAIPFGISPPEGVFTARLLDEDETSDYTQAGGHPLEGVSDVVFNQKRPLTGATLPERVQVGRLRQIIADIPPGIVGNQLATPVLCPTEKEVSELNCPSASIVGEILLVETSSTAIPNEHAFPIFALEPELGVPAAFAFPDPLGNIYLFSARLRPEEGYAVSLELAPAPEEDIIASTVTICDFGPKLSSGSVIGCFKKGEAGANPKPLFTNPTRCGVPLQTRIRLNSWADPTFIEGPPFANAEVEGCEEVPFEPTADLQPSNHQADSPTGLDVELSMPTEGLEKGDECHEKQGDEGSPLVAECLSESHLRQAKITFPEGMSINASAGQGLIACSADQVKLGTNDPIACPQSSKICLVEIETPVLKDKLKGSVYIAKQGEVEGATIGLYMVFDSPKNGILVKQPVRVDPDPQTGQLVATVNESPQQPFSAVHLHCPTGPQATLLTPPKCGTYEIASELIPWSGGAPVIQKSSFQVNQGPGGGPCPTGGLDAHLSSGSENPLAGQTSPFNVRLSRPDGSDRFTALGLHLPPGLTAYLKGVPYCPEAAIARAKSRSGTGQGQTEIDSPSCPAASQIGRVIAGAGAGDNPLYVDTGRAYLAGPYKGAPLSIVAIAPAVAGPLDLGTVVVRNAVKINPRTAEVDAVSDPIPTILHGVLLDVRDVRVQIDRQRFTLNPTDCSEKQVGATVSGLAGGSANLANRFQVGGCENLGFKPNLQTRLFGGTHRGDFPRFKATYKPRPGDSNLEDLVLRFPRSEFIEQGHFRTICTRVQYAAGEGLGSQCPPGSVYGHIEAVTPILDEPLSGPVYLRSSDHNLPDVVFALHGQVNAEAAVRIDSVKGGLRASIEDAPDVPLTRVVLNMQGRQKGLFVNSRDVCATVNRATLRAEAHNDRRFEAKPALKNSKCNKGHRTKQRRKRHR
jgi:hypothetical protein